MGCIGNIFKHVWINIKVMVISTYYTIMEVCCRHRRLEEIPRRDGEYAVVTGGNRGIGWESVKTLVESGMNVIVGCRDGASKDILYANIEKAGLAITKVEWIELDTSSMNSVRKFAQKIIQKNNPISLLINNAGVMFVPYSLTEDGFESHFAVNYLGHFLLTHLLMPQLKAAGKDNQAARVVNVSSSAHAFGWIQMDDLQAKTFYSEAGAYSQSKLSQVMFTEFLNDQLAEQNAPVHIYALHPGIILSNLYRQTWYARLFTRTMKFVFKTEAQGADRVIYVALAQELENLGGCYFENCKFTRPIALARNRDLQEQLWNASCKLLDIEHFGMP